MTTGTTGGTAAQAGTAGQAPSAGNGTHAAGPEPLAPATLRALNEAGLDAADVVRAVRAALRRVEDEVLNDHVAHCVEGAIASGDAGEQRRKVQELMTVLVRRDD